MGNVIGANIRRLREERGWSQSRLARETCNAARIQGEPVGRQEISRYEHGKRTPREWLPHVAAALGVRLEDLTSESAELRAPKARLRDYLPEFNPLSPVCGTRTRRLGSRDVQDIAHRAHGLRLADDVISGGDLIRPALRELRTTVKIYRESTYTESVGNALLSQIGEMAQIAGWIAGDAGHPEEAERVYRLGMDAARQAADGTLLGYLAGSLAYQFSNTGREEEGIALAQAAVDEAGRETHPTARALYMDRLAWAHTKAGDARSATRALGDASEALAAGDSGRAAPDYVYWMSSDELKVMEARCYTEARKPLRAVPLLRDVLARYDVTHTRELALYLSWLAVALTDANEPEEAAEVARRVIDISQCIASDRTSGRVRVILHHLLPFANVPEVAALLEDRGIGKQ
ncbi:helix-turn-helix domain-containing protein [Streptomyces bohaiensis]|uniref:helix-turn-helix domain-containing protein n=1 Tax=Streptomyces bohaiensis TaxID=1431344 RepID=UPI003B7E8721